MNARLSFLWRSLTPCEQRGPWSWWCCCCWWGWPTIWWMVEHLVITTMTPMTNADSFILMICSENAGTTVLESLWRLEEMLIESEYYWEAYPVDTWGGLVGLVGQLRCLDITGVISPMVSRTNNFPPTSRQNPSRGIEIWCFFSPLRDSGATITTRFGAWIFFCFGRMFMVRCQLLWLWC